jgi:hypothetical protein
MAAGTGPVHAAWDNVFQVCCNSCRNRPILSRFFSARYSPTVCCAPPTACCAPPTACCAPPTVCTTQYVQRCYYQPVTSYQSQTYYEPVTTYRTSYYWEPVTSYRYSCYYDPCTCTYRQVACPVTSYRLRSQCSAVTSYLQRTCCVPVTSYRLAYYYEPMTSCYSPCTSPCPPPAAPAVAAPVAPGVSEHAAPPTPGVNEQRSPPPPANPADPNYRQYYPSQPSNPPPVAQPQQPHGGTSRPQAVPQSSPPPRVRLDRIVSVPGPAHGSIAGQVVQVNNRPSPGVQLTFVRADQAETQPVTADTAGRFNVLLASGGWHVYLTGADGQAVYHSRIEVNGSESRQLILVNR